VTSGESVTVAFQVTVNEAAFIENMAVITDRYGITTTLRALANARRVYLPVVLRG